MPNKFSLTLKLARANSQTGYLLVFFPTLYGLLLAKPLISKLFSLLPLFILGSITTRSCGSIINDLLDRKFDQYVARTKERPLANGSLSVFYAMLVFLTLAAISLVILLSLTPTAIYIGLVAAIMITLYPLMKRITYFPQIFLAVTFNLGTLIAYAAITETISMAAIIMYLACCFWTIAYDTIYGYMDIIDDKKIGLRSMAIFLEKKNYKLWLSICYLLYIILFTASAIIAPHHINYDFIVSALILLLTQTVTLDINNPINCLSRFKNNNYVGVILALALL